MSVRHIIIWPQRWSLPGVRWGLQVLVYLGLLLVLLDPLMCTFHCCPPPSIAVSADHTTALLRFDATPMSDPGMPGTSFPHVHGVSHAHCAFTLSRTAIVPDLLLPVAWMIDPNHARFSPPDLARALPPP